MPAIDRQGQRASHPDIIERLLFVVWRDQQTAIPVARLHRDLIAERAYQFFASRRRQAAELDRGAVAADRIETGRLLRRQDPDDAVKIRQPLVVVIRVRSPLIAWPAS